MQVSPDATPEEISALIEQAFMESQPEERLSNPELQRQVIDLREEMRQLRESMWRDRQDVWEMITAMQKEMRK